MAKGEYMDWGRLPSHLAARTMTVTSEESLLNITNSVVVSLVEEPKPSRVGGLAGRSWAVIREVRYLLQNNFMALASRNMDNMVNFATSLKVGVNSPHTTTKGTAREARCHGDSLSAKEASSRTRTSSHPLGRFSRSSFGEPAPLNTKHRTASWSKSYIRTSTRTTKAPPSLSSSARWSTAYQNYFPLPNDCQTGSDMVVVLFISAFEGNGKLVHHFPEPIFHHRAQHLIKSLVDSRCQYRSTNQTFYEEETPLQEFKQT